MSLNEAVEGAEHVLTGLQAAYLSADSLSTPLNTSFREALRIYAETYSFIFSQDTAGNIYITQLGHDPDLAPIAVSFPLDGCLSKSTFVSAFRVFSLLSREKTKHCGLVLVGWTSLDSRPIGQEIWNASVAKGPREVRPELVRSRTMPKPWEISVSAIVEVSEEEEEGGTALKIEGSPVLVGKACTVLPRASADIRELGTKPTRAPVISIRGPEANSVACALIRSYSTYVVGLFDNFE